MARPLKIPLFLQPATGPYCGPTCIKMLLAFYGKKVSLKYLVKNLPMTKTGIDMFSMGNFLNCYGLVTVFEVRGYASKKCKKFLKDGGILISRAVRISDIRKALARNGVVILNVKNDEGLGHYVIVKNIGRKKMTINDPADGTITQSIKRVMKACHDLTGGAMIISK